MLDKRGTEERRGRMSERTRDKTSKESVIRKESGGRVVEERT